MLVYDFLFGQGIQCGGDLKHSTKHKSALQSCLARLKIKAKVYKNEDLLPKQILDKGMHKNMIIYVLHSKEVILIELVLCSHCSQSDIRFHLVYKINCLDYMILTH